MVAVVSTAALVVVFGSTGVLVIFVWSTVGWTGAMVVVFWSRGALVVVFWSTEELVS